MKYFITSHLDLRQLHWFLHMPSLVPSFCSECHASRSYYCLEWNQAGTTMVVDLPELYPKVKIHEEGQTGRLTHSHKTNISSSFERLRKVLCSLWLYILQCCINISPRYSPWKRILVQRDRRLARLWWITRIVLSRPRFHFLTSPALLRTYICGDLDNNFSI